MDVLPDFWFGVSVTGHGLLVLEPTSWKELEAGLGGQDQSYLCKSRRKTGLFGSFS